MIDVSLHRGLASQHLALQQLAQLYIHDFTDFLAPEKRPALGEDGRFADVLRLDDYWTKPDRAVWFIRAGDQLAGFALLNTASHCGRLVDFNMGEFFVARPYRRDQVGMRAAVKILEKHAGRWEIAVGARNLPAQAFWPRVVAQAKTAEVETLAGDGVAWTGPILRFVVKP